jgi:hypothetical protein
MDPMDMDAKASSGGSSGASAASRVQGIVDAAEATAAEIVGDAKLQADRHIEDAKRAAELIRAEALAAAEEHLAAVQQATASLRSSVGSVGSISCAGRSEEGRSEPPAERQPSAGRAPESPAERPSLAERAPESLAEREPPAVQAAREPVVEKPQRSTDLDGARLVALNMVLAGDSREAIDRYLNEHFDLPRRAELIDEVCAAVEG